MTTLSLAVSVIAVILLGISAGVHLGGIGALNPALRALDAATYTAAKQSLDQHFPGLMKPLTLAGLLALLLQVVLAGVAAQPVAAGLAALALLAAVSALVAVLRGDLPINAAMATWDRAAPPGDWSSWRERWERYFRVRTVATSVAFLAALAALVTLR